LDKRLNPGGSGFVKSAASCSEFGLVRLFEAARVGDMPEKPAFSALAPRRGRLFRLTPGLPKQEEVIGGATFFETIPGLAGAVVAAGGYLFPVERAAVPVLDHGDEVVRTT
jgi:hypothetical protein